MSADIAPLAVPITRQVEIEHDYHGPREYLSVEATVWLPADPAEEPWVAIDAIDSPERDDVTAMDLLGDVNPEALLDDLIEAAVVRAERSGLICRGGGQQSHRCDCALMQCRDCGARGPWDRARPPAGSRGMGAWRCRPCGALHDDPREAAATAGGA